MKKIGYLIFPLLLLIACSSNQATSPSSQHSQSPETVSLEKEYEQIVDQYEAAAKEKVLKVSDYPLVNPVSLQMAHTYTGDGDLDIESEKEDLNGDGQEELLIGTDTPTGTQEQTIYTAIYGLLNGKVVDLTKDLLGENEDNFLLVYTNNRIRLDKAKREGKMVSAVYELTTAGYKELLYIETDANQSSAVEEILIKDRDGNLYRKSEVEPKLEEVIGHGLMEQVLE